MRDGTERKIWLIACGSEDAQHRAMWQEWKERGHITVGCNSPPNLDLTKNISLDQIKINVRDRENKSKQANILHKFAYKLQSDDYVIIRYGQRKIFGIGKLQGGVLEPDHAWQPGDHYQRRKVIWLRALDKPIDILLKRGTTVEDTGWAYKADLTDEYDPNSLHRTTAKAYNQDFIEDLLTKLTKQTPIHHRINTEHTSSLRMNKISTTNNRILYGPPGTGKTHALTSLVLSILATNQEDDANHISYVHNIINGADLADASTEDYQSWHAEFQKLVHAGRVEFTTFHQNYAYEDFVEGLKAELDEKAGTVHYKIEPGILKRIAYRALYSWLTGEETDFELSGEQMTKVTDYLSGKVPHGEKPEPIPNYVLIIDEINRGNVARIFGELITLVEDSKRACREISPGAQPVFATLPYTKERFILPPNLHIIGTMNTADRSLIGLDAALRRRFDFVELTPRPELLDGDLDGINLQDFLCTLNQRIEEKDTRDHCIGHAYFMAAKSFTDIQEVMRRKVIPQLQEYFHDRPAELKKLLTVGERSFVNDKGVIDIDTLKEDTMYAGFTPQ